MRLEAAAVESISSFRDGAPGPGDDRMLAEQQRGVLDEHRVGIVGKLGQADDLEPGVGERPLIIGMLAGRRGQGRSASRSRWVSAHSAMRGLTARVKALTELLERSCRP